AFYATVVGRDVRERLWEFVWPSAIALLHPTLLPVAIMAFFSKVLIKVVLLIGGPFVGKLMDHYPKVPATISISIVQAASQLLSAAIIFHAHSDPSNASSSIVIRPWFVLLVIAGSIERLCGVALAIANSRYWVVQLAGRERPLALAQANAVLIRIQLLSEVVGASIFGVLLCKYDPVTCLKFASTCIIGSLPMTIALTVLTDRLSTGVLSDTIISGDQEIPIISDHINICRFVETLNLGWREYIEQPVLPASVAYVIGSFNVVLCPGSLMTAFLTQRGIYPSIIGAFSGLCSAMGVATTFLTERLVKQLGILKAIAFGLILQTSLLVMAVTVYWSGSLSNHSPIIFFFFLGLIVLSRMGSTSSEVVGEQVLQMGIPPSKANLIGITEASVASLAESLMMGVAMIVNKPSHYGLLVMLSAVAVVGSTLVYCRWAMNPTMEQQRIFSSL
ncbi:Solute carrier family 40 member 3, chloroplastic, partial [Linum perenne]